MAGGGPLVDGGTGEPPLLRRRAGRWRARGRLPRRGGGPLVQPARELTGSVVRAQAVDEPAGRSMEIEEANRLSIRVAEPVHGAGRGRDECPWTGDARLVSDAELDLP